MSTLTVRNLDAGLTELLKLRGLTNGRSMEAEARAILAAALTPTPESGSAFAERIHARFIDGGSDGVEFSRPTSSPRTSIFEE